MRRREFVALAGLSAVACGGDEMTQFPVVGVGEVPWKLWGDAQTIRIPIVSGGSLEPVGQQLVNIQNKLPTTWAFWLGARLIGGSTSAAEITVINIDIDLILGLGRTFFSTKHRTTIPFDSFANFNFQVPATTNPGQQPFNVKYTDRVQGPPMSDTVPGVRQVIDRLTFSTLQVEIAATASRVTPGGEIIAEVSAFFAPMAHVRPDWFADGGNRIKFKGGETDGR